MSMNIYEYLQAAAPETHAEEECGDAEQPGHGRHAEG